MQTAVSRGEIYYIEKYITAEGEQSAGRPAIIVSNALCNTHSPVVEVVYLTTQPKKDMPTHVTIRSTQRTSTALCEQISSVSKERIGDRVGKATSEEMRLVDAALLVSLGISNADVERLEKLARQELPPAIQPVVEIPNVTAIEAERDIYKKLYGELLDKLTAARERSA